IAYPLEPGYSFAFQYADLLDETDVQHVDLALDRAATVSGVVLDRSHGPVAGASVFLFYTDPELKKLMLAGGHALEQAQTDAQGVFEHKVKPGVAFRLEASSTGWLPTYSHELVLQAAEERRDFRLALVREAFRVVVTVLDEDNQPLAGVPVVARSLLPVPKEYALAPAQVVPISGRTDEQGRVELAGLSPGRWLISAAGAPVPGPGARYLRKEVELPASAAVREISITLQR
ncbi:MAG: hypothetical protein ACRD4T_09800, partial [Candidatus Acidiferrales bacterium]